MFHLCLVLIITWPGSSLCDCIVLFIVLQCCPAVSPSHCVTLCTVRQSHSW